MAWELLAIVAIVNGGFREVVLIPRVGEYAAHVVSTGVLAAAILIVSFAFFRWPSIEYALAKLVGVGWAPPTVGFNFLVGDVGGTPALVTIGQYDVSAGQVWIAVPLTLLLSPLLFGR